MNEILNTYEHAIGQAITFENFKVFFSRNVDQQMKNELSTVLGVSNALDTG